MQSLTLQRRRVVTDGRQTYHSECTATYTVVEPLCGTAETEMSTILQLKIFKSQGAWVAQLVERPTLDRSSGHDLIVCETEPHVGLCADSTEPAWDIPSSLSLSLSLSRPSPTCVYTRMLSLSQKNKLQKFF